MLPMSSSVRIGKWPVTKMKAVPCRGSASGAARDLALPTRPRTYAPHTRFNVARAGYHRDGRVRNQVSVCCARQRGLCGHRQVPPPPAKAPHPSAELGARQSHKSLSRGTAVYARRLACWMSLIPRRRPGIRLPVFAARRRHLHLGPGQNVRRLPRPRRAARTCIDARRIPIRYHADEMGRQDQGRRCRVALFALRAADPR